MSDAHGGQERVLDPLELELQKVMSQHGGYWELNPGLLKEQHIIFVTGRYFVDQAPHHLALANLELVKIRPASVSQVCACCLSD